MKIIDDLYNRDFPVFKQYKNLCVLNSCAQILSVYNVPYYFLRINCSWDVKIHHADSEPYFHLTYEQIPLIADTSDQFQLYSSTYYSKAQLWDLNRSFLDRNIPVIVGVDRYYLPYHEDSQTKSGAHTIVLCGYDDNDRVVYFKDWYNHYQVNGILNYDTLDIARSSENSWNMDINSGENIRYASLILNVKQLYGKASHIKTTLESLEKWYDASSYQENIQVLAYIYKYLSNDSDPIQPKFQYTHKQLYGLYLKKCLYADYIKQANPFFNDSIYQSCIETINELEDTWKNFMLILSFISEAKRETRVQQLLEQFHTYYKKLMQVETSHLSTIKILQRSILYEMS